MNQLNIKSIHLPQYQKNNQILMKENIKTNWEYRQYVQKHGHEINNFNMNQSFYESGNTPYTLIGMQTSKNVPFMFQSLTDNPPANELPFQGVGLTNSDLKELFVTQEERQSRMIAPQIVVKQ